MKSFIFASLLLLAAHSAQAANDEGVQFFESKIRPLFIEKCYTCHSSQAKKLKGGLYLDNREKAYKGGESGLAFTWSQYPKLPTQLALEWAGVSHKVGDFFKAAAPAGAKPVE